MGGFTKALFEPIRISGNVLKNKFFPFLSTINYIALMVDVLIKKINVNNYVTYIVIVT